ncbi:hypothetical protein FA09DRAFT_338848 [Tilletiopsis washingtonensis]|uniref:NADH dehydrogenase [ubiquinone] 1 alpha subcomplex subunit 1 n=1 Tax=Tilletiopsis washingtonensis TaxID=58919 RepID=A0A316ZA34_9BASI|nr:hypothetical protein FA09DRAFT_338848 [Tilletiopsis washingtonensis]PWN97874.1 hypothetical protein FA09DRAFT_338848 [Tilletiopsis washingtonensis]
MPVPWEAFIPMGLVVVMFGVTGTGFNLAKRMTNDGKPQRHSVDDWDDMMMRRDQRLTGSLRGQATDPIAKPEFATSSVWNTEKHNI